jgi:hypothetical protein
MYGFFNNKTNNSQNMMGICDQDKILKIQYSNHNSPANLIALNSQKSTGLGFADFPSLTGIEGFTSGGPPGSYARDGFCPDGHTNENGNCKQICKSCKYNDRTKGKSTEFNEADSCFSEGVFNGFDSSGLRTCTCGRNNQYCSKGFLEKLYTVDGMFSNDNDLIINIANANDMETFALFE